MGIAEPLVSVVIPTHNRSYCIVDAINTAAQQTYKNREIIVVDDGSNDDTLQKLAERQLSEPHLKVVRFGRNLGVSSARNIGVETSQGKYIAFLDSDDLWMPEKLAIQVRELQSMPPEELTFSVCNMQVNCLDHSGNIANKRYTQFSSSRWGDDWFVMPPSTWVMPRAVFDKVGPFNTSITCAEDYDWQVRFFRLGGRPKLVEQPLSEYRYNPFAVYRNARQSVAQFLKEHEDWMEKNHPQSFRHLLRIIKEHSDRVGRPDIKELVEVKLVTLSQQGRAVAEPVRTSQGLPTNAASLGEPGSVLPKLQS